MSKMKSTLAATLLALVFAFPALAGSIGSPGGSPPPPPPPPTVEEGGSIGSPGSPVLVDILLALLGLL